jgi:acyl transferase domain-containing protein
VRRVVLGGDALFAKDVLGARRHFPATCSLMNRLTSSEALSQTRFVIDSTTALPDVVVPVGYPEDDKDVLILGEDLRELAPGKVGEIAIRSAYLTPGYWHREDLNRATFLSGPPGDPRRIYRTGDLGRLRPDGCLEHLGRSDRQVKIRGYRVELGAIEATLTALDAVKEAAVVVRGRGDDAESSQIVAYVVPAAEPAPSIDSLRAALAVSLPDYMIPASFVLIHALPMTATGKVDRAALPAPAATRPNLVIPFLSPRTEVEQAVAKIWAAALGLDRVGAHDNFFDLGGDSLLLLSVHARLRDRFAIDLPVVDMFRSPTVAALGAALAQRLATGRAEPTVHSVAVRSPQSPAIAIIGMAGVFPGAADLATFWTNLRAGVESIAVLDDETLRRSGVDEDLLANPRYVKRVPLLPEWKAFDAAFFGLPALDAALLDPQHRMLLQVAWHALEHAGAATNADGERIGIFAGCCQSAYFLQHLWPRRLQLRGVSDLQLRMATDPEFLATRIAYKLDLRGPAVNVQTACSTSLVAVHLACQSLARGECEIALAGGASVETPEPAGYLHEEGWISSPDGRCRPFDARAQGTVIGSGAGMVVLKPLERAVADGDTVHAMIRGSALNNDGALKVGFAAPSVEGQAQVIAAALAAADLSADDIDYVETHGTGTALGDPIEIAALTSAFRATSARTGDCPIGAVKSNVGHLSRAAGITGLIKTVLCLEHGEIPPSLHFEKPNPQIDFSQTPFVVNRTLRSWPERASREGRPRMAAVSSFGVGGTNAHAIVEQAPAASSLASRPWQLIVLSARTETALAASARNLARALDEQPGVELADVAFTLQAGRRAFEWRQFVVCRDRQDAVARLSAGVRPVHVARSQPPNVVFLFPGQGAQYPNMGRGIYDEEPVFRAEVDRCAQALRVPLGVDLREVLFPNPSGNADPGAKLRETWLTQPALFTIQYALAKLWMHWGVHPSAMLGHSIGEHTAACLAGVMSLDDTLAIIARRGRLLHALPRGCMVVVHLDERKARGYLSDEISLAAVNAPSLCVMAGAENAIRGLMATLAEQGIDHHLLHTSHAFHSAMMDPVLDDFTREVAALSLRQPSIPYVSGVTGDWIAPQDAVAPDYWSRLLRGTVRFSDGLRRLSADPTAVFLEVGPGRSLITLARQHEELRDHVLLPTLRSQGESRPDREVLLATLGELWRQGVPIDWRAHHGDPRRKIPLPQYPFEPREHWIGRAKAAPTASSDAGDADLLSADGVSLEEPRPSERPTETPASEAIFHAPASVRDGLVLAWLQRTLAVLSGAENSAEIPAQTSLEEAGIDSLASIRLCAWIEAELKVRVAVKAILSAESVSGLAALLSETIGARERETGKTQKDHHG